MKRLVLIFATVVLFLGTVNATTFYVSPNGDNSDGTTWAKAWTHPNSTNGAISSGDTVEIAPSLYDTTYIDPPNATTGWTVYACSSFATYYETGRSTVILSGAVELTAGWTNRSGNVWRYNATIPTKWNTQMDYNLVVTQGDSLIRMRNSNGLSAVTIAYVDSAGEGWYDNSSSDSLFIQCHGDTDPNGETIRASIQPLFYAGSTSEGRIKLIGLSLQEAQRGPVWIGTGDMAGASDAPDSIEVLHCNIRYGGDCNLANNPALVYGGFSSGAGPSTANSYSRFCVVRACSLQYCWSPSDDYSGGAGVDSYVFSEMTFDSNYVSGTRGGGVMFKYGGPTSAALCFGNVIAFNTFDGGRAGIWWGPRQDSLMIYGNIIKNSTYRGIDIHSTGSNVPYYGRNKIFNNTLYNCGSSSGEGITITPIADDSTGINEIRYNVIYNTATSAAPIAIVDQQEATDIDPVPFFDIDNNMYYAGGSAFTTAFAAWCSCSGTNFAAWQACGFDANGSATTNPSFNNAGAGDFSRPSASGEMSRTYGGRTWSIYGAVQNDAGCPDTLVAPVFESPANGATGQQNSVILDWSDSTQAGTVDVYDLQVDNNSDFSSVTFSSSPVDSRDTVTIALQYSTTYYWRIRGRSDCDTSAWSGYRSFTMRAWPLYQDTCLQITEKVNLNMGDTCYCIDSVAYTFAQRDTLIHTNGYDNIRIWGVGTGRRGLIRFSASDAGNLSWKTDTLVHATVLHLGNGSNNVKIKNLAIVPVSISDSIHSGIVCIVANGNKGVLVDNCSLKTAGFTSRAFQSFSWHGAESFNIELTNSYFGTDSKGYRRRDQMYGATVAIGGSLKTDPLYQYLALVHHNDIETIHSGIYTSGGSYYPVVYLDSNTITVDARNDLYMTYTDNVNSSTADPFGIIVDGADSLSHVVGNTISSMGASYYGGDGLLLQHINASSTNRFEATNNTMTLQHGLHPALQAIRQYCIGVYARNYDDPYFVKGLHLANNSVTILVDTNQALTYRGIRAEGLRLLFENGSTGNLIENNHIVITPADSATRTGAGTFITSGITWAQQDSTWTGQAGTGNNVARNNYYRVPRQPIRFANERIGATANNVHIIGDTVATLYAGDSTFAVFDQNGTYFYHSIGNTFMDMVISGNTDISDVIKGNINTSPTQFGKQLSYLRSLTVNLKDVASANVNGGTIWAIDAYGNRTDLPTTNGSGNSSDTLRWRFFGYDALPADGYVVADSNGFNNFTFWGKQGYDSVSASVTVNWTASPNINLQLTTSTPPTPQSYKSFNGTILQGVIIK